MSSLTRSSARTEIRVAAASVIAGMAAGGDPNLLSQDDVAALTGDAALVLDGLRRRPRYFDGRFLTGADLTRDQEYVRQRQADLARACGTGVVAGLQVSLGGDTGAQTLVIEAGHGITPSGDIVMVTSERSMVALDLPTSDRLDVTFGLSRSPRVPLGRRSGLFVLALRSVEFTANPIAAYPATIAGQRSVQDGDVIEATSISLIPWPDTGGSATIDDARRAVARQVFTGAPTGLPQDALPLAMIGMDGGAIRWIDQALVRRETGADTPLQVSMGARPRALAEAFLLQHRDHLADVLEARATAGLGQSFAATQYFAALPPAGQLPAAAILMDALGFKQLWFPAAVDVTVSFVPSDEIAAVVEDSLALPPIDLLGDPADLDATSVVVLAPVTRQRLQQFEASLAALSRATVPDPAQGIRRAPADMLAAMLARRSQLAQLTLPTPTTTAATAAQDADTKAWQAAWNDAVAALPAGEGQAPLLWYVRRRAVADRSALAGMAVAIGGDDEALLASIDTRMNALGFADRLTALDAKATPFAAARIAAFLGSPAVLGSDLMLSGALHDLEAAVPQGETAPPPDGGVPTNGNPPPAPPPTTTGPVLDPPPRPLPTLPTRPLPTRPLSTSVTALNPALARINVSRLTVASAATPAPTRLSEADVVEVASFYGDPRLGEGFDRLQAQLETPLDSAAEVWAGGTGLALALDSAARDIGASDLPAFADGVAQAVAAQDAAALGRLVGAGG